MTTKMADRPATEKQKEFARRLYRYLVENGCYPTIREMCDMMVFSGPNAATNNLRALAAKGVIEYDFDSPAKARGYRLRGVKLVPVIDPVEGEMIAKILKEGGSPCQDEDPTSGGG